MKLDELLEMTADADHFTIYTSLCKADRVLLNSYTPVCSISGGSDSDLVLDLIHKVDKQGKVTYYWIDTGLEYRATKEHLDYFDQKYGSRYSESSLKSRFLLASNSMVFRSCQSMFLNR